MVASGLGAERNREASHACVIAERGSPTARRSASARPLPRRREQPRGRPDGRRRGALRLGMGHDFRPDYLRLPKAIERLAGPRSWPARRPPHRRSPARSSAASACTTRWLCAPASTVRFSPSTSSPLRARAPRRGSWACSSTAWAMPRTGRQRLLRHAPRQRGGRGVARAAGLLAAAYHAGMAPDERAAARHGYVRRCRGDRRHRRLRDGS